MKKAARSFLVLCLCASLSFAQQNNISPRVLPRLTLPPVSAPKASIIKPAVPGKIPQLALPLPAIQPGIPTLPSPGQDSSRTTPDSPGQSLESAQAAAAEKFDGAAQEFQELTQHERWDIEEIEEKLGPRVAEEKAPALHRTLLRHFERLSSAQQRLYPSGAAPINRIFIIDTPEVNAFVKPWKPEDLTRRSNLVFVTTGLLKKISDDGAAMSVVLTRLAGVLSHELAHPLDNADSRGLGENYFSGQAREIRADTDGMAIAREAGYPVESVHTGLKKIFEDSPKPSRALYSAINTHPHDELRLAAQRMLLTLDRRAKGEAKPKYPGPNDARFLQDLSTIDAAREKWKFKKPASFDEAVDRYLAIPASKAAFRYKWIEENRLLLFIDDHLSRRGEQASPHEISRLIEVMEASLAPYRTPMDESAMRKEFTSETASLEFLKYPPHEVWMTKIPAYRSKPYVAWVRSRYSGKEAWKDRMGLLSGHIGITRNLLKVCPPQVIFSELREALAKRLLDLDWSNQGRDDYETLLYRQPLETRVRMAELMVNTVLPKISEAQRLQFVISELHPELSSHLFPQTTENNIPLPGVLDHRMELMGDPRKKDLQEIYRRLMAGIWKNRGYFGMLDLAIKRNNTDWEAIFSVLGIDRQAGYSQLRHAVKRFSQTPAYAELLGVIRRQNSSHHWSIDYYNPKRSPVPWMDDTLTPYLAGKFIKIDDKEQEIAGRFAKTTLLQRPAQFSRFYREGLKRKLLGADTLSREDFLVKQKETVQEILDFWSSPVPLFDMNARLIADSGMNPEKKKALLRSLLLTKHPPAKGDSFFEDFWLYRNYKGDGGMEKAVVETLIKTQTVSDTLDLFEAVLESGRHGAPAERILLSTFFQAVSRFKEPLLEDLRAHFNRAEGEKAKFGVLRRVARSLLYPGPGKWGRDPTSANTRALRELKAETIHLAQTLSLDVDKTRDLFEALSETGPTRATDDFFLRGLAARYERLTPITQEELRSILEKNKILSSKLQLELAKKLLAPEIAALESSSVSESNLRALVAKLNKFVPAASIKKDDYLEEIAWRLQVEGALLGSLIEDQKSYNWRRGNPLMVNLGSAAMAKIASLPVSQRILFIEYLLEPEKRPFPVSLLTDLERSIYDEFMALNERERPRDAAKLAKEGALKLQLDIEQGLMDATPLERIPLFELLLAAGQYPLLKEPGFIDDLSRRYLGYAEQSREEKLLKAYLKIIPEHERSVSLAYLLSQIGEDKSSVKNLFQVFQTVGVKFGQLSSIWKIFGEAISRETASLKDRAEPMTKAEVLEELHRSLSREEFSKIKRLKRVIGSASLKTVVLAEFEGNKEAVIMVQRRFAQPQIDSNLRLAQDFINEIKRENLLPKEAGLFDSLLETVRSQLAAETKMSLEARHLREAKSLYTPLDQNGWTFKVPGLIAEFQERDNVLVLEKADGVRFDQLPPKQKVTAGEAILRSSLRLLFQDGWFDADRHVGNQLIDSHKKIISPIDFGQAMSFSKKPFWRSDDRLELARFLRALADSDQKGLSRAGMALGKGGAAPDALAPLLDKALAEKDLAARVISVVNAFAEAGVPIDGRFSFGALKGLMTLYGEEYVSPEKFKEILKEEIRSLMIRKTIPLLLGR